MTDWIPRKKRKKISPLWLKAVVAGIIFVLVAAMGILFQDFLSGIMRQKQDRPNKTPVFKITPEAVDSLLGRAVARIGLGPNDLRRSGGFSHGRADYRIDWPRNYPSIWLVKGFQSVCNEAGGLVCIGTESNDGAVTDLEIRAGVEVVVNISVNRVVAAGRAGTISFAIENFAGLRRETIVKLIETGTAFGFFLKLGEFPDATLAKELQSSLGECILEIPTDASSWEIILKARKFKVSRGLFPDESVIRSILEQAPRLKAISLVGNTEQNRSLTRRIIAAAAELELDYIYMNDTADFADSLAYSAGLRIIRRSDFIDTGDKMSQVKSAIMERIGQLSLKDKGCFVLPGTPESIAFLSLLKPNLDRLGLKIIPPSVFIKPTEKL